MELDGRGSRLCCRRAEQSDDEFMALCRVKQATCHGMPWRILPVPESG